MKFTRLFLLILLCGVMTPSLMQAQTVNFDESVDGELSGDNTMPTIFGPLGIGSNTVTGTVVDALGASPNVDVFTFQVAAGEQLDSVFLDVFNSDDDLAFIGLDDTTSFPFDAPALGNSPDQSQFIGGLLFGGGVGTDILDDIGSSGIGTGFSGPLQAGDYTVYLQQLGGLTVDYQLSFNVSAVPEPGAAVALMLFGIAGLARRRR